MLQRYDDKHGLCGEQRPAAGDVGAVPFEEQLAAIAASQLGREVQRRAEPDRREVVDLELPGDSRLTHQVEHETEQVIHHGRDRTAVHNPRRAAVPGVEDVPGEHPATGEADLQLVAVSVVRPAPQAQPVVRLQDTVR